MSEVQRPARKRTPPAAPPSIDAESFLFAQAGPTLVLDRQGRVLAANPPALELLGAATSAQLQHQPFEDFLESYSHPRWQELLRQITTKRLESRGLLDLAAPSQPVSVALGARRVEFAGRPLMQERRVAA
ncbi:MAG: PAS domain-containing protein, partial [Chloroflexi bacterium]|nr:PAS domain-containing protein [Chloroflexota bacterium]